MVVNRTGSKIDQKGIVSVVVGRGRTWLVGDEQREFAAFCTDKKFSLESAKMASGLIQHLSKHDM